MLSMISKIRLIWFPVKLYRNVGMNQCIVVYWNRHHLIVLSDSLGPERERSPSSD